MVGAKKNQKGRKIFYFFLTLMIGGEMGCAVKRIEEAKPSWKTRFPVMVTAHRGFSGEAPENTLAAFRKAIEVGSDMLELDIHFSQDRQTVVIHDETLERTTSGRGKVVDKNLAELKKLDAGSWFGHHFSGEQIPTLKEVLELAKERILINIEIKNPTHGRYAITELAERALEEVKKANMTGQVIFSSFNPLALERIKEKEPGCYVALLFHRNWNFVQEVTGGKSFPVLNLRKDFLTKEKIARIHGQRMLVNVYTVDAEEELEQFVRWGIDGIITNQPKRLIEMLQKKFPIQ